MFATGPRAVGFTIVWPEGVIFRVLALFAVGDVYVSLCKKNAYVPFSARRKS